MAMDVEFKRDFFKATVCPTCGFCKEPRPGFCLVLYDADPTKFIKEIVKKMHTFKATGFDVSLFTEFEGFTALFCRPERCSLHDEKCETLITTRTSCYQRFLSQMGIKKGFVELSRIYSRWSGADTKKISDIGDKLGLVSNSLSKRQRKKVKRAIQRLKESAEKSHKRSAMKGMKGGIRGRKEVTTGLFYSSRPEWKEKISIYLEENEWSEDNNRQQDKAHKCAGESD